jgi:hypothetical protein
LRVESDGDGILANRQRRVSFGPWSIAPRRRKAGRPEGRRYDSQSNVRIGDFLIDIVAIRNREKRRPNARNGHSNRHGNGTPAREAEGRKSKAAGLKNTPLRLNLRAGGNA